MNNRRWITREEIAEIYDSLATRRPATTLKEQSKQKRYAETAANMRANDVPRRDGGRIA